MAVSAKAPSSSINALRASETAARSFQASESMSDTPAPTNPQQRYIVLEGIDASGKSSLAKRIAKTLQERGYEALFRFEPTDGPFGRQIRALLSQPGSHESVPGAEWMRLFKEDRAEHTSRIIRPALERDAWVVQDRSYYSTAAYQGAQGVDLETILRENRAVAIEPSLILVLDLSVESAHERIAANRDGELDSLEERQYLSKVADFFGQLQAPHIVHIDAEVAQEAVFEAAWSTICSRWPELA